MHQDIKNDIRRKSENAQKLIEKQELQIRENIQNAREIAEQKTEKIREDIQEVQEKAEEQVGQIREELEDSRKSDDTEDYFDKYLHEPPALFLAKLFIKAGWTPNMVTMLSMCFGVVGGILFFPKKLIVNIIGICLHLFSYVLDCTDGMVARMTDSRSQLGRVLDGTVDGINFAAAYLALGFRMMSEQVPFAGGALWGIWIWPIILFCGIYSHAGQARIADYYRNVHLYFMNCRFGSELVSSSKIHDQLMKEQEGGSALNRIYLFFYEKYTALQEKETPKLQMLLARLNTLGEVPDRVADYYTSKSRRYIQITNLLTFNLRAFSLYIMLVLGLQAAYSPFIIIVLGALKRFMVVKYEGIAEKTESLLKITGAVEEK